MKPMGPTLATHLGIDLGSTQQTQEQHMVRPSLHQEPDRKHHSIHGSVSQNSLSPNIGTRPGAALEVGQHPAGSDAGMRANLAQNGNSKGDSFSWILAAK